MWGDLLTVDGVVSHSQGDGPLRLGLDTCLCVCSVCVVVFGLYNILLALTWVHGDGPDPGGEKEHHESSEQKIYNLHLTATKTF